MRIPKGTVDYMDGVIYKAEVTLYKTAIPNPLSLLSEDVINKEGTDFVNLRNTFQIDNLATYNGAGKVGYFKHADAINRFCVEDTYPSTGGINWHLPDFFEWNTILYDPRNAAGTGYTGKRSRIKPTSPMMQRVLMSRNQVTQQELQSRQGSPSMYSLLQKRVHSSQMIRRPIASHVKRRISTAMHSAIPCMRIAL